MKYIIRLSLLLWIATTTLIGALHAQVYTPPTGGPDPVPAPSPQPAPSSANNGGASTQSKSILGEEVPFLDPTNDTISFGGRTFPVGDTRLLGARYDKYLNEPEDKSNEFKDYRKIIKAVMKSVAPVTPGSYDEKIRNSVKLMEKASQYDMDANLCSTITNAVYTSYLSKKDINYKKRAIQELDDETKRLINKMKIIEERRSITTSGSQDPKAGGQAPASPTQQNQSSIEYVQGLKRLAEIEVLKKKYESEATINSVQSKILYQAMIVQLFVQRRFEHALIACQLYNMIFNDGDAKLRLQKGSDASKVFGETMGMPPTVSTVEAVSQEIILDTTRAIEAIDLLIRGKQLTAANKRLAEAYFLGEYLEPVRVLPLAQKQQLFAYTKDLYSLVSAIDGKDFTRANELVTTLKANSADFDDSKATSYIEGMTRASDLHLANAQKAMIDKDNAKAQEEVKQAMTIWPKNPRLKDLDKAVVASNELVVAKQDFERLLAEGNYRQIFKDQYRYAPVIQGDSRLEDAFKQIIENILEIEKSIAKAKEFANMGQPNAAWEELRLLRSKKVFSTDPELGKQIEELSPRVSELASSLDTAKRLEDDQETGSALSWYMKARSIYPNSKYANDGIERLMKRIFSGGSSNRVLPEPSSSSPGSTSDSTGGE